MGIFARTIKNFNPNKNVPEIHRQNFTHLYFDFGWVGVLTGSTLAFLSIYAARIGANGTQIGLISAIPAVINLVLALPSGVWLAKKPIEQGVVSTSFYYRLFYVALILIPLFNDHNFQIWLLLLFTLLQSIPNTAYAVGYNAFLGEAVPVNWRSHVASYRNAYYSFFLIVTSLICGILLEKNYFSTGYQVVFFIGIIGALLSTLNLYKVKILRNQTGDKLKSSIGQESGWSDRIKSGAIENNHKRFNIRKDVVTGPYGKTILILLIFYLFIYLPIPLFPLYTVNVLHKSDGVISLGSALFYLAMFAGSSLTMQYSIKYGNKNLTALGSIITCIYPLLLAYSYNNYLYYICSFLGGAAWAFINVGLMNYLLEKIPSDDMPAYMAWYNIVLNAGILLGSLGGAWIGS